MYRFFKHNGVWFYIEKGSEKADGVGTYALEGILGVTGTREVVAMCRQPSGTVLHVTVINGFIVKVEEITTTTESCYAEGGDEIFYEQTHRDERTEFYAEAC